MMVQSSLTDRHGATPCGLVYVSMVSVDPEELAWTLADIQTVSVANNTACDITGVLIATPRFFAQYLEGAREALDDVMARIEQDVRHREIRTVRNGPVQRRIGVFWRLMRFDAGSFEERHVTPVLERAHERGDGASVDALMHLINKLVANRSEGTSQVREPHP